MVTLLTAKEVHKLFQFLQENLGNKNWLLFVKSNEIGEQIINVDGRQALTKSFIPPLHPILVVSGNSHHTEAKGGLEERIELHDVLYKQ